MVNFVAVQFISGSVYFAGLFMGCFSVLAGLCVQRRWPVFFCRIAGVTGFILVLAAATPVSWWVYALWGFLLFSAMALSKRYRWGSVAILLLFSLSVTMAAVEMPWHLAAKIPIGGFDTLYVVGDSLTQGARPPGRNWPELLGEKVGLKAVNLGVPGAKVGDALVQTRKIGHGKAIVLLEIGGNDLLDGRGGFEKGLDELLSSVCQPDRLVVMVELPLLPTFNRFGAAQRRLAKQYDVVLIPKKVLAGVLGAAGATEDGLHFSNEGHRLLAERLSGLFVRDGAGGQ